MRKYGFSVFLLISFLISMPLFVVSTQQTSSLMIVVLFLLGSYAPALAAWIVISRAEDEERQSFRRSLKGWGGRRWLGFAVLMPSVIWLVVFGNAVMLNKAGQPLWTMLVTLPVILLVNYGEEVGWRGYALPYLMKRFNPFIASLIVGLIWGLFHVALNLQKPLFGLLTMGVTISSSVILTWMFINTKSILPGTFFHAVFNAWTQVFLAQPGNEILLVFAIVLLVVVAGYLVTRYGKGLVITQ